MFVTFLIYYWPEDKQPVTLRTKTKNMHHQIKNRRKIKDRTLILLSLLYCSILTLNKINVLPLELRTLKVLLYKQ